MSNTHSQSQSLAKATNMSKHVLGDKIMTKTLSKSAKDREKQCYLILSLLSQNLNGKLIFSQKRVSKASNLIACF